MCCQCLHLTRQQHACQLHCDGLKTASAKYTRSSRNHATMLQPPYQAPQCPTVLKALFSPYSSACDASLSTKCCSFAGRWQVVQTAVSLLVWLEGDAQQVDNGAALLTHAA